MRHTQIDPEALKQVKRQIDADLRSDWREYQRGEMGFWEIVTLAALLLLAVGVMAYPVIQFAK